MSAVITLGPMYLQPLGPEDLDRAYADGYWDGNDAGYARGLEDGRVVLGVTW